MSDEMSNHTKIERWLRPLLFPFDSDESKATVIAIKHISVNDKLTDVRRCKVEEDMTEGDLNGFIIGIESAICDDAEGIGGLQKYQLHAYAGKVSMARLTIRYRASSDEDDKASDSEPADGKGLTAQAMRHNEVLAKTYMHGMGQLLDAQGRIIENQRSMIEMYSGRFLELEEAYSEVMRMKDDRELERTKMQAKIERNGKIADKLITVAPTLVKALAGKVGLDVPLEGDSIETQEIDSVLGSLDPEQLEGIAKILKPEQMMVVASMMERTIKKEAKQQQRGLSVVPKPKTENKR